jgi:hypothetical protein
MRTARCTCTLMASRRLPSGRTVGACWMTSLHARVVWTPPSHHALPGQTPAALCWDRYVFGLLGRGAGVPSQAGFGGGGDTAALVCVLTQDTQTADAKGSAASSGSRVICGQCVRTAHPVQHVSAITRCVSSSSSPPDNRVFACCCIYHETSRQVSPDL